MEEKTAMKNVPQKIYLQVDPEDENPDFLDDDSGITWSTGKVHETDIEYVLPAPQREDGFLKGEVGSSVSTEETIIDFAMWYSGMERGKVESAFERYKREVLRSRLTAKEKGK